MQMEYYWTNNFRRNLCFFLILISFYGCGHNPFLTSTEYKNDTAFVECKIIKIDTFMNYYFIYAKGTKDGRGYKIISMKPMSPDKKTNIRKMNFKRIEVDNIYRFRLVWVSEPSDEEYKKGSSMEFERCIIRFPNVKICTETGFELYESSDINGLVLINPDGAEMK
jgi:hypothetical protein